MESALQTEVVLETIFKFLPYRSLKNVRLVNKKWNKEAISELRKRSAPIHLDHDLHNFKKFYKLELLSKNQEIAAKIPMSVHVRSGGKSDWKILKDLATHEPWKTRVTTLMLSDFWAEDINRLLPFLLNNLPNLTFLDLSCLNNNHRVCESVIPWEFVIPDAPMAKKYALKTFNVFWYGHNCRERDLILDPTFLAQCASLKEFLLEINGAAFEVREFFKLLNKMDPKCFASVEHVQVSVQLDESDKNNSFLMNAIAQFINRAKPTSLDFTKSDHFDPIILLKLLKTEIRCLKIDIPYKPHTNFITNWLLCHLRKLSVLSKLEELNLRPSVWVTVDEEPPLPPASELKHHLEKVTNLKISFDLKTAVNDDIYGAVVKEAAAHLPNVEKVDFCSLYLHRNYGAVRLDKLTHVFKGLKQYPKMQKLSFQFEDWSGDLVERGQTIIKNGPSCKGIFSDLALLKGSALQEFSISAKLDYNLSVDSALVVFFIGYEPSVKVNLDFNPKSSGRAQIQLTKEEFCQALKNAKVDFKVPTPGDQDLMLGSNRYLKMRNYKPYVGHRLGNNC